MRIRLLTDGEVPAAMELSAAAGWNQTAADWHRLIALEPGGCFGVDADEKLVATTTLLCFGTDLAWLGMVLTHRDHQRRGLARALVCAALDVARGRGVRCIKLDATDQGHALYSSLGFVDEQAIERWRGAAPRPAADPRSTLGGLREPGPGDCPTLDTLAFGADRSAFIEALGPPLIATGSGYIITRPGSRATYLGPCVARDAGTAASMIGAALSSGDGPWFWDVLPSNQEACRMAESHGLAPVRRLMRMRLGSPVQTRDDMIYAIAGFEAG